MYQSTMKPECVFRVFLASTLFLAIGVQCVRLLDELNESNGTRKDLSVLGYVVKLDDKTFAFSAAASEGNDTRHRYTPSALVFRMFSASNLNDPRIKPLLPRFCPCFSCTFSPVNRTSIIPALPTPCIRKQPSGRRWVHRSSH